VKRLVCLHGFLGQGGDWKASTSKLSMRVETPSLFAPLPFARKSATESSLRSSLQRGLSLADAARAWVEAVRAEDEELRRETGSAPERFWTGYSLGGRALLHAIVEGLPAAGVVFVSAGLGIPPELRPARVEEDEAWARRFESEEWSSVLKAWNSQEVLRPGNAAGTEPTWVESDYDRARLAAALRAWSLGRQEDLRERLGAIRVPTLWLAGERDLKYQGLVSEAVARVPGARQRVLKGAGHRLPYEATSELSEIFSAL
jgi:pimeloyl-ACP methyl ester carboxylesterase